MFALNQGGCALSSMHQENEEYVHANGGRAVSAQATNKKTR